jgi:hypothetical protein
MKFDFCRQSFEKYSKVLFHENLSSGNQVVPCGQTDEETDVTKSIVAFRNFSKVPKIHYVGRTWKVELRISGPILAVASNFSCL